jgi:hypothetical protein
MRHLLILILISVVLKTQGQDFMPIKYLHFYDKNTIDSIVKVNNTDELIIFQTMLSNDSIIDGEDEEKITSFLFYLKNDMVFLKKITKHAIYESIKIDANQIFTYKSFNFLGADKSECSLKFTPPGLAPFKSDIIIANLRKYKFYYEFNSVGSYIENKNKLPFRKEYDQILRNIVLKNTKNWKFESENKRLPLFTE